MSKRPKEKGMVRFLLAGVMLLLACNALTSPTDTPPPESSTLEKIQDTPKPSPSSTPQATKAVSPPPAASPVKVDISNACTLSTPEELSALFSDLPVPSARREQTEEGDWGSICRFFNEDVMVELWLLTFPDYTELNDVLNNIQEIPDFIQFSVSNTNFYQAPWPTNESGGEEALAAVILKGGLEVQIIGTGKSYKYNRERESSFLLNLAKRLPNIKSARTPCTLVTVKELSAIFPNPSVPNNEMDTSGEYPVSICGFRNDTMEFEISVTEDPDLARTLSEDMETAMSLVGYVSKFSTPDVTIYQMGGRPDESRSEEIFRAVILKNNLSIQLDGSGRAYRYDPERELSLLQAIAGRLP